MKKIYLPTSIEDAEHQLMLCKGISAEQLDGEAFVRVWCSISFLNPGLHPDDFDSEDGGWSPDLRNYAAEAWRRYENGLISDRILYPSDATHAGLRARMKV